MKSLLSDLLVQGFLAFARVAGCLMVMPGFSSIRVPQHFRLLLVLFLAFVVSPMVVPGNGSFANASQKHLLAVVLSETVVGLMIGMGARIYIQAIGFMGTAASAAMGFSGSAGPAINDSDAEPTFSAIVTNASLILLFIGDFHHDLIAALADSYRAIPVGMFPNIASSSENILRNISDAHLIVFKLASPFLAYALLVNVFISLLNRLVPSMPVFFVATPAVLLGALAVAYHLLPTLLALVAGGAQGNAVFR